VSRTSSRSVAIAQRRQQVAGLYLQGWPQAEIGTHMQVAQSTVSNDLKRIQAEWRQSAIRDFDTQLSIELQKLDRLEREAWAAWERSQKPAQQARVKGGGSEQNAERLIKNQVGDPRFLDHIHKCIAARRALLGLDAPTRLEPVLPVTTPLTLEQRRQHIKAIIHELQTEQPLDQPDHELRAIETHPGPDVGRETAHAEPADSHRQNGP